MGNTINLAYLPSKMSWQSALGRKAAKPLLRVVFQDLVKGENPEDQKVTGFNLHVSLSIEAHERPGLERTLRYMGRPPLSAERLKLAPGGEHPLLTLKSPWRDGTSKIILTPFELLELLVAIVPPPKRI